MIDILSPGLELTVAILAVAAPLIIGIVVALRSWGRSVPRRIGRGAVALVVVLLCQALGLVAVFLHANNTYAFYTSWDELFGRTATVSTQDLVTVTSPSASVVPVSPHNPNPGGLDRKSVV